MAGISLGTNFDLLAQKFLDSRQSFETIEEMKNFSETSLPDGFMSYNKEDKKVYQFKTSNTVDVVTGKWREFASGSGSGDGIEHKIVTKAQYQDLIDNSQVQNDVIYIVTDDDSTNEYALKEDVYRKEIMTIYTFCQSSDTGALEIVADGAITTLNQVELSTVQAILPSASVGDYVLSSQQANVTSDPLFVKVTEIMDTLNSQYTDRPLSAYQGYVLARKFMKQMYITSNNVLTLEFLNGDKFTYDLTAFLQSVINSIGYGKVISCDELPTCADDGTGKYIVTYKKNGVQLTCEPMNTWFYYQDNSQWYQTLFVDGVEVTILAGAIADTIKIDENTKTWWVNGADTGIYAQGISPEISENPNNDDLTFKLDVKNYDYSTKQYNTTTTPNLRGRDSVQVPLNGFYKVYVENNILVCEVENGATPPPLALETISGQQCLTYTVGGTIQGTLIS